MHDVVLKMHKVEENFWASCMLGSHNDFLIGCIMRYPPPYIAPRIPDSGKPENLTYFDREKGGIEYGFWLHDAASSISL